MKVVQVQKIIIDGFLDILLVFWRIIKNTNLYIYFFNYIYFGAQLALIFRRALIRIHCYAAYYMLKQNMFTKNLIFLNNHSFLKIGNAKLNILYLHCVAHLHSNTFKYLHIFNWIYLLVDYTVIKWLYVYNNIEE